MRLVILFLLLSSTAFASEVVIVKSDNTTIKTKQSYEPRYLVQAVEPKLEDPMRLAHCFEDAINRSNRSDRYTLIDRCLEE